MEKPLITVIVPVYNVEQYLDKCIKSITAQTYDNLEIILVDDGSPDSCPQLCDSWAQSDSRIKVIHKQNGGLSSARNAGIAAMSGEYVCFIDSDDWIEPDMLEIMFDNIKDGSDVVVCNANHINASGEIFEKTEYPAGSYEGGEVLTAFFGTEAFDSYSACDKLYRSRIISSAALSFDEDNKWGEDYPFNYQFFQLAESAKSVEDSLYNYFMERDGSITYGMTYGKANRWRFTKLMLEEQRDNPQHYAVILKVYCSNLLCCLRELLRSGDDELIDENYFVITDEIKEYSSEFLKMDNISAVNAMSVRLICAAPSLFRLLYSGYIKIKRQK
jgi:glycosyltransferase involved in cell wall biosynthesis